MPGSDSRGERGGGGRSRTIPMGVFFGCGMAFAVILGLVGQVVDLKDSRRELQRELDAWNRRLSSSEERLREELARVTAERERDVDDLRTHFARAGARLEERALDESRRLFLEVEAKESASRRLLLKDLAGARAEILRLERRLERALASIEEQRGAFHRFQEEYDPSILLIHSRFTYTSRGEEGEREVQTGCGWGTGFVVSAEGYVLTNKHVVQPWKFDPDLAAMIAMGEVEIDPDSLVLVAWRTGSRCQDEKGRILFDQGFNNTTRKDLHLYALARDHMEEKTMPLGSTSITYNLHALDNNDLAVLKVDGARWKPVPCADEKTAIHKLDPVMTLGFPRGQNGLERGIAETSPSLGTVRKVEDTIHITAPIIPGNSGGPVFSAEGRVIGIATRIYSETLGICIRIRHGLRMLANARELEARRRSDSAAAGAQPAAMMETLIPDDS